MFLIDTNVVSELRNPRRADANVRSWAAHAREAELHISVVTVLELERGVLAIERRHQQQGVRLRAWLEAHVIEPFLERTLPIDVAIARRCAGLHVPDPRPARDALIAATALVHGMTIVTRNVSDFVVTGVALLNPWEPQMA